MRPILVKTLVGPAATVPEDEPCGYDADGWPIYRIAVQGATKSAATEALRGAQAWHKRWGHTGSIAQAVGVWPA